MGRKGQGGFKRVFGGVIVGSLLVFSGCGSDRPPTVAPIATSPAPGTQAPAPTQGCLSSPSQAIPLGAMPISDDEVIDAGRGAYHLASAVVLLTSSAAPLVPMQGQAQPQPVAAAPVNTMPSAPGAVVPPQQLPSVTFQLAQAVNGPIQPGQAPQPMPPQPMAPSQQPQPMAAQPMPGQAPSNALISLPQRRLPMQGSVDYTVRQVCQSGSQTAFDGTYISTLIPERISRSSGALLTRAVTFQVANLGVLNTSVDAMPGIDSLWEYGMRAFGDFGFGDFGLRPGLSRYQFYRVPGGIALVGTKTVNRDYFPVTITNVFRYFAAPIR